MFGTLKRAVSIVMAAVGLSNITKPIAAVNHHYQGPPVPLLRARTGAGCRVFFVSRNGGKTKRTKGRRDRSLKIRSNRRKAAR